VLLLGPLYHLIEADDRLAALREARRVLTPGGVLAAATISRLASTFDGFGHGYLADPRFAAMVERDVRDGVHHNPEPEAHPEWFTTAYFHRPAEVRAEIEAAGLVVEALLAIEGRASYHDEVDEWRPTSGARWRWRRSGVPKAIRPCSPSAHICWRLPDVERRHHRLPERGRQRVRSDVH
jgi:hypothetical protein